MQQPQKDTLTEEILDDTHTWLEASPEKVITPLGSSVRNAKEYSSHWQKNKKNVVKIWPYKVTAVYNLLPSDC
jgi:hypothetical protein